MALRSLLLVCAAALVTGCATTRSQFPSRDALAKLAESPPPPVDFGKVSPTPESWTLEGPLPSEVKVVTRTETAGWDGVLRAAVAGSAVELREELHCVAHEAGRYYLDTGDSAPRDLTRFIAERCGSSLVNVYAQPTYGDVPADMTDGALLEAWSADVSKMARKAADGGASAIGIWAGRKDGKAAVLIAAGEKKANVDAVERAGNVFLLRGSVLRAAEDVGAMINRGAYGFADCVATPGVQPPQFEFRCEAAPEDANARIEISAREPGHFLSHPVAKLSVSPSGTPDNTFTRMKFDHASQADLGAAVNFTLLVNDIRARAGVAALELDLKQSATAERIAPHYFGARQADPEKVQDVVALGLMAGWDVEGGGLISDGNFLSSWQSGTKDVAQLVASTLRSPNGRRTLLAAESRRMAVGPLKAADREVVASLVSTYAFFEERSLEDEVELAMDALNTQRAALGLEPAMVANAPGQADQLARQALADGADPGDATSLLMDRVFEVTQAQVRGWTVRTHSLTHVKFPDEMVRAPRLAVVMSVGRHRPENEPWGEYVIMVALPDLANVRPVNKTVASR